MKRLLFILSLVGAFSAARADHWVVSWGASPSPQIGTAEGMAKAHLAFDRQTLRETVHLSLGGSAVRVRLSNAFGKQPVMIGSAHILLGGKDRALLFSGRPWIVIPPDALAVSDAIEMPVPPASDLVVSIYLPTAVLGAGIHYAAQQTNLIVAGDHTGDMQWPATAKKVSYWAFLTGADVQAPDSACAIAAFGDSITDGAKSTLDVNHRWPNFLAARLLTRPDTGAEEIGVLDAGIGGNRLLHDGYNRVQFGVNALARFDRDVLAQPGVRYVIVLEGINDIGHPGQGAPASEAVTARDIIGAYLQIIARAHEHGIKVYGGTLTPFEIATAKGYFTPDKERIREEVNSWIRTAGAFDGVIDFEAAVRDPAQPGHMLPAYDSGDHLHPNDEGYEAMGNAIDLALF